MADAEPPLGTDPPSPTVPWRPGPFGAHLPLEVDDVDLGGVLLEPQLPVGDEGFALDAVSGGALDDPLADPQVLGQDPGFAEVPGIAGVGDPLSEEDQARVERPERLADRDPYTDLPDARTLPALSRPDAIRRKIRNRRAELVQRQFEQAGLFSKMTPLDQARARFLYTHKLLNDLGDIQAWEEELANEEAIVRAQDKVTRREESQMQRQKVLDRAQQLNTTIDPQRWKKSQSVGDLLVWGLLAAAEGYVNPRGNNRVLAMMNQAIERDIDAQLSTINATNAKNARLAPLIDDVEKGQLSLDDARSSLRIAEYTKLRDSALRMVQEFGQGTDQALRWANIAKDWERAIAAEADKAERADLERRNLRADVLLKEEQLGGGLGEEEKAALLDQAQGYIESEDAADQELGQNMRSIVLDPNPELRGKKRSEIFKALESRERGVTYVPGEDDKARGFRLANAGRERQGLEPLDTSAETGLRRELNILTRSDQAYLMKNDRGELVPAKFVDSKAREKFTKQYLAAKHLMWLTGEARRIRRERTFLTEVAGKTGLSGQERQLRSLQAAATAEVKELWELGALDEGVKLMTSDAFGDWGAITNAVGQDPMDAFEKQLRQKFRSVAGVALDGGRMPMGQFAFMHMRQDQYRKLRDKPLDLATRILKVAADKTAEQNKGVFNKALDEFVAADPRVRDRSKEQERLDHAHLYDAVHAAGMLTENWESLKEGDLEKIGSVKDQLGSVADAIDALGVETELTSESLRSLIDALEGEVGDRAKQGEKFFGEDDPVFVPGEQPGGNPFK